jgi:hypothetical protein
LVFAVAEGNGSDRFHNVYCFGDNTRIRGGFDTSCQKLTAILNLSESIPSPGNAKAPEKGAFDKTEPRFERKSKVGYHVRSVD